MKTQIEEFVGSSLKSVHETVYVVLFLYKNVLVKNMYFKIIK